MRRAWVGMLLIVATAACGGDNGDAEAGDEPAAGGTATSEDTVTSTSTTTTAAPTEAGTVPAEVVGSWRTLLPDGDEIILTLRDSGYQISRVGAGNASGRLDLEVDALVFSNSIVCDGTGRYQWTVGGGNLQLRAVAPDECPSRAAAIDGHVFEPR